MTGKCNAMRELMNLSDIMNFADTRNDVIFPWPFSITSMRSSNGGPVLLADESIASGLETTPSTIFNGAPRSSTRDLDSRIDDGS